MPAWKRVIVSGSDATLTSVTATAGFTGSLLGTASYATQALSASYASYAATASISTTSLNTSDILVYVKNVTGTSIPKGKVVRINGATGDNALITTASWDSDGVSANTLGILNETIANDAFGYALTEGTLLGIDTSTFTSGQLLFLGPTGSIISSEPHPPYHAVRLGQALRIHAVVGSMYVRIDNGYELDELHNVLIISGSDGDLLVASGSNGNGKKLYINSKQLTGSYAITGSLDVIGSFNQASASLASGLFAHAQGFIVTASGIYSHAEGQATIASGLYSHAEGQDSTSTGQSSHAEGFSTTASGSYSHAEGRETIASGLYSHAEGWGTIASGDHQHVQGQYNQLSSAQSAFIVGNGTADGARSNLIFASGSRVQITGSVIATAGFTGSLQGTASYATVAQTVANASLFALVGSPNTFTSNQIIQGYLTLQGSLNQGTGVTNGNASHAQGNTTTAGYYGYYSGTTGITAGVFALDPSYGDLTSIFTSNSFVLFDDPSGLITGIPNVIKAQVSSSIYITGGIDEYTEVTLFDTTIDSIYTGLVVGIFGTPQPAGANYPIGNYSHAEGESTTTIGLASHAEGTQTTSQGYYSHAEGDTTTAYGYASHAEGYSTTATGPASHAEGYGTVASGSYQHVQGQFNIASSAQSAFIVGNGTADGARSNLIFASGSQVQITGSLIVSGSGTFTNIGPAVFSGSVASTAGFTGSLQGTASFALAVAGGGGGGDTTAVEAQFYFLM